MWLKGAGMTKVIETCFVLVVDKNITLNVEILRDIRRREALLGADPFNFSMDYG